MRDAYIVTSIRTPGCKRNKGAFKDTRPEDLLTFILNAAVEKTQNLEKKDVEDIMIGCSFPEAEQARAQYRSGCVPDCRFSGGGDRRHRKPLLCLGSGSHCAIRAAGHGRLV